MLKKLRESVYKANLMLVEYQLVTFTWGNVSEIDRSKGLVAIKPSGIPYSQLKPGHIVIVDLDGKIVEGKLNPSSDTPTHLVLYKQFETLGGIVHTHSIMATAWAQSGRNIPAYGTTHADYFYGGIPCTRKLTEQEVSGNYEKNTGMVIVERFNDLDPKAVPGVVVHGHAPFAWGKDAVDAVNNAVVLEEVAKMAYFTEQLGNKTPIDQFLLDKHYYRKHGKDAYYGQKG